MTTYPDRGGNNPFGVNLAAADRSGTITTGGTAQVLAAATATRKNLSLQNISSGDLWINEGGTAVIGAAGSFKVPAGESYYTEYTGSLSIIGATTSQAFTAKEV